MPANGGQRNFTARQHTNQKRCRVIVKQPIFNDNYITVKIGRKIIRGLLDTGSGATIINERIAKQLHLTYERPKGNMLFAADGSQMPVVARAEVVMYFGSLGIPHTVQVVQRVQHDLILGADFLKANRVMIDYKENMVSIADDLIRVPLRSLNQQNSSVKVTQAVCTPPMTECILHVSCPHRYNNQTVLLEPLNTFQFKEFAAARSISCVQNGRTVMKILNYNPRTLVLRRGTRVASIENVNTISSCTQYTDQEKEQNVITVNQTREELDKFLADYKFKLNPNLSDDQKYEMLQLLFDYKDVFARSLKEVKHYPHYQLELDLVSNRKVYQRQYRLHPKDADVIQEEVNQLKDANLIEPAETVDYNSRAFIIQKKDGSARLVLDYRRVNQLIAPVLVELPHINELIDSIMSTKCKYMSSWDLKSGYYQIWLHENSREVTSFTAPDGLRWRWRVTPFGINVSPTGMLTVLTKIFSRKTDGLIYYMDDMVINSGSWSDHLRSTKTFLQTLQKNNLTANPTKCEIGQTEIEYLGFRLSEQEIRISERKIKAIQMIQAPKTKKSLQRVIGLVNFWRSFVPNFAQNTVNMRLLLTKDAPFEWNEACQNELAYLKQCLTSDPLLKPFDSNRDLIINCDANATQGIGFALMQFGDDDKLHVISYGSQALRHRKTIL